MEEAFEMPPGGKNPMRAEHLKEGVRPIMACVGTPEQFDDRRGVEKLFEDDTALLRAGFRDVDYYGKPQDLENANYKNAGPNSYAISPADELNKFSRSFVNCTGLVVTGQDGATGRTISFFSHQDPEYFLGKEKHVEHFVHDLRLKWRRRLVSSPLS